jgi:preprotein translocase subunit SecY
VPGSSGSDSGDASSPSGVSRTPVSVERGLSRIVPVIMFGSLILGVLMIVLNYIEVFGDPSNTFLFGGLALVLVGIVSATQYK